MLRHLAFARTSTGGDWWTRRLAENQMTLEKSGFGGSGRKSVESREVLKQP